MIPHPERAKGAAAQPGADSPGRSGPVGQAPLHARPVLARWLHKAHPEHPVLAWQEDDHARALDAFEELLSRTVTHPGRTRHGCQANGRPHG